MTNNIWEKDAYYTVIKDTHPDEKSSEDVFFSRLNKILKNTKDEKILDVGCGEGWLIEKLSTNLGKDNFYTGIDISTTGINRALARQIKDAEFYSYDGTRFPFSNETFDVTISGFVFEHLSDPLSTFNEMTRVTKKGGLIIIACPNFGSPLFKSPCNKNHRLFLMLSRFIKEFTPKMFFKDEINWDRVTPIELPEDIHISDYDTLCEPNLSSFEKFISNHPNKYLIKEADSLWNSYDYEKISSDKNPGLFRKNIVNFAKFLGIKKILRFQYFGLFFFTVIKKL